ncbi:MAG: hypothetical protein NTY03_03900, partial [Candidatus Bathyarchaeota archaeon]|nr:hypothetical protein [Candidatus Bathyarchaeota archaeon]
EPHAEKGVEPARQVLKEINIPLEMADEVLHIVEFHDVKGRGKIMTLEGRVVWDADKIDLIGLTGVSRAFYHAGETKTSYSDAVEWCINRGVRQPYEFFTKTGQEISKKRFEVMKDFAVSLKSELSLIEIK